MSPPHSAPDDEVDRDQRLMARVGAGDREAFVALYDRYGVKVMRFLHGLTQDPCVAEDLTQETFVRAWVAAPRWRPHGRVSTWLFQIAKRLAWRHLRRRGLRRVQEARAARARARHPPGGEEPAASAARSDEAARIAAALEGLAPKLRLVFVLVRIVGLSYAETARIAGIRLGTVKSRMAAAEARLRRHLRADM